MGFVHLHNHTHYSLLDGLPKIKDFVAEAKKYDMPALAITDHGTMYGVIEFYEECKKQNIKPIIGVEFYLSRRNMEDKKSGIDTKPYHLILLAKNNVGYKNLLKLTTDAHLRGFYYKPRIDWETLSKNSSGLIASTACLQGQIPQTILSGNIKEAENLIKKYQEVFGEDFYLEMQHHPNEKDQILVNKILKELGQKLSVGLVATNDIHYLHGEDKTAQDILVCIQSKKKLEDKNRMNMTDFDLSFRSPSKMAEDFIDTPSAIENTIRISEKCDLKIELGKIVLPHFELPSEETNSEKYVEKLCKKGITQRYGENPENIEEIKNRVDYELSIIEKTGFASYFLIVADFVNWAKENGIVVGPGRGSAAGSIVSYLLNITDVDPLKYGLLFERFLNPERISMPDIDIDFADIKRDKIIKYVEQKYCSDHVAQIITFGTMASRAAIRDVGRVLNLSYAYCDKISKMIPSATNLKDALKIVPEFKEIYAKDQEAKNLIDFAIKLEGVARHHSVHACGVLISKDRLEETVPIQYASSSDMTIISQYSLHPIEDLGLLKMDFLGLNNLTILENVIEIIEKIHDKKVTLKDINIEDKKTFTLLKKGQTTGVFQLESSGMKKYLKQLRPDRFEDIIAMVALYRPGPMQFIPDFIAGKHGKKTITYDNPKLEPILKETYGIAVYQEQIMEIAKSLAGFTYGEADVLRKAVGKKIKELLDQQKEKLIEGMTKSGISSMIAKKIWDSIEPFASYGFNKSHATCYALIAFQTAYFKANYPTEFMASLLTAEQNDTEKLAFKIKEAKKMGIEVLSPDINKSYSTFTVLPEELKLGHKKIRFGLNAVKNVGINIVKAIVKEKKENGDFDSLENFLSRIQDKDLNKKSLESLIKSGALSNFEDPNILLNNIDKLLNYNRYQRKENTSNQSSIFGQMTDKKTGLKLDPYPKAGLGEKLFWEKEMLGLYISDHPFRLFESQLKDKITPIKEVVALKKTKTCTVGGSISLIHKIVTKNNENMLFVTIEDGSASIEIIIFPKLYQKVLELIKQDAPIIILGKLSFKDDQPKMIAEEIQSVQNFIETGPKWNTKSENNAFKSYSNFNSLNSVDYGMEEKIDVLIYEQEDSSLVIKITKKISLEQIEKLKKILKENIGENLVYFIIKKDGEEKKIKTNFYVKNSIELKNKILSIVNS